MWTSGTVAQAHANMAELAALAETAGSQVLDAIIQRRSSPDAATTSVPARPTSCARIVVATGADTVIADGELTPAQLTALEGGQGQVIDRTALILDIFAQHATSREGKAQVSLAQMEYMLRDFVAGVSRCRARPVDGRAATAAWVCADLVRRRSRPIGAGSASGWRSCPRSVR